MRVLAAILSNPLEFVRKCAHNFVSSLLFGFYAIEVEPFLDGEEALEYEVLKEKSARLAGAKANPLDIEEFRAQKVSGKRTSLQLRSRETLGDSGDARRDRGLVDGVPARIAGSDCEARLLRTHEVGPTHLLLLPGGGCFVVVTALPASVRAAPSERPLSVGSAIGGGSDRLGRYHVDAMAKARTGHVPESSLSDADLAVSIDELNRLLELQRGG